MILGKADTCFTSIRISAFHLKDFSLVLNNYSLQSVGLDFKFCFDSNATNLILHLSVNICSNPIEYRTSINGFLKIILEAIVILRF